MDPESESGYESNDDSESDASPYSTSGSDTSSGISGDDRNAFPSSDSDSSSGSDSDSDSDSGSDSDSDSDSDSGSDSAEVGGN